MTTTQPPRPKQLDSPCTAQVLQTVERLMRQAQCLWAFRSAKAATDVAISPGL